MRGKLILLILVVMIVSGCSNPNRLIIWTEQSKIQKVKEFEYEINADMKILEMNVSLSESVFPRIKEFEISKPLIVLRENTSLLPMYAEYFYSNPDSILRYVSYNWEDNRYANFNEIKEDLVKQSSRLNEYNTEYEDIKTQLVHAFGSPIKQDIEPLKVISKFAGKNYLERNTIWESDKKLIKLNMIFGASTYRIRLSYYWI